MKKILLSFVMLSACMYAQAQISITSIASPYTQDFNTLSNDTTFANTFAIGLTGWEIFEKGTSAVVDQKYKVNNGSRTAGDTYSYGDSSDTERALGTLGSGTNKPSFGVAFQNNTGSSITDVNVSYKGEHWRSGDTCTACLDSLVFEYSTSATSIGDTTATWNAVSSLMLNTVNLSVASAGALPGNATANSVLKSGTISVLIPNSGKILFRWRDINKSSSDDGLAIDDLSVSFSASGNPKPSIVSLSPADDATLVSPTVNSLTLSFDQTVVVGTGNITVSNLTDVTQQTIACGTTTVAGAIVSIPGVTLLAGKQYAIQFDSTCYKSASNANSYGIYDNTSWNFSTMPNSIFNYTQNNLTLTWLANTYAVFQLESSNKVNVVLSDLNGKVIRNEIVSAKAGENRIKISMDDLSTGMYLLHISSSNLRGVLKIVK